MEDASEVVLLAHSISVDGVMIHAQLKQNTIQTMLVLTHVQQELLLLMVSVLQSYEHYDHFT